VIVTRRFAFLHLHKSGGTFVNQFLMRYFDDAQLIGYHLPRAFLPPQHATLPLFGLVRNPWDYYLSWYSFQATRAAPNALFSIASDNGRLGFAATVTNLVNLGEDPARLARLVAALPDQFTNRGINLTRHCIRSLSGCSSGFYAWMFERMYGDGRGVTFGRMETLRDDLRRFLEALEVPLEGGRREFLASHPPLNTSRHPSRSGLYDADLRDLVARKDAAVINRFGYAFAMTASG
jgi:hypothetical protein